ncbi:MAG: FxsA family protein [Bacillota bacterium]
MFKLILLFTIIPLLDLTLLIKLSNILGIIFTISLVAITGLTGAILIKSQGTSIIIKIGKALDAGMMPADSLIEGFLVFVGAILLVTPGLLTDLVGFSCIVPLTRARVKILTRDKFYKLIVSGKFQFSTEQHEQRSVDVTKDDKD